MLHVTKMIFRNQRSVKSGFSVSMAILRKSLLEWAQNLNAKWEIPITAWSLFQVLSDDLTQYAIGPAPLTSSARFSELASHPQTPGTGIETPKLHLHLQKDPGVLSRRVDFWAVADDAWILQ